MIYQSPRNPNSHLTIKQRTSASFPTRELLRLGLITGKVLDFGSGLGIDGEYLRERGFEVTDYDPYYAPQIPQGKYDTILCNYVLNVLLPEEQSHVIMAISELLNRNGSAFYTVRRDIRFNGFRTHIKHKVKVYQCNVELPFKSIRRLEHCEIYEYRPINQRHLSDECPFCAPDPAREIISESVTVYAMYDRYPVNPGHALIIPKQHTDDYFAMPERLKTACWIVTDRVRTIVDERFQPDGFNIGVNVGTSAGQTIPHVHIHLIPRYSGDTPNPTGGVRGVIPGKSDYRNADLSASDSP